MLEDGGREAEHRELLRSMADDLALAYEQARTRLRRPVLLLVDRQDSLGARLCEHYKLPDELNILPVELDEALGWLAGRVGASSGTAERAACSLVAAPEASVCIVIVAGEAAAVEVLPL